MSLLITSIVAFFCLWFNEQISKVTEQSTDMRVLILGIIVRVAIIVWVISMW
jgi:hypothetical protein